MKTFLEVTFEKIIQILFLLSIFTLKFQLWDSDFMKEPSSVYEILQNSDLDKIRLSTVIPYLKLKIATLPTQTLSPADDAFIKNLHATLSVVTKVSF